MIAAACAPLIRALPNGRPSRCAAALRVGAPATARVAVRAKMRISRTPSRRPEAPVWLARRPQRCSFGRGERSSILIEPALTNSADHCIVGH